ncbi:hypothetical protein [Mucilaginibacter sp.]|uniref:hypothetical protein n=1 Tax=Mucilaginibacter sp. TaxID=1882438 RepID=UPI002846890F|nr:hypothetical protein [Mucilaginibacter sp.]MDR3491219.1 hypothetical protein [Gammaproteobacteria bacterium]MDR3697176.1 hypothetical protein [Mucilaginibacter sp.]
MEHLKNFIKSVPDFSALSAGKQIKYFVFFLQHMKNDEKIAAKNIKQCFDELHLNSYSNIAQYLTRYSKRGIDQEFLRTKNGYILFAKITQQIETEIGTPTERPPSNSLYPLAIFEKAPSYLTAFASEASSCYDLRLYNSCLFMLRKICEILIIELFESKGIESKIKTPKDDYLQLADLIKASIAENSWKLSKIVKENLPKIKLLADSSVHSKRFRARKSDIEPIKTDVRIIFEELVTLIDYPIKKT